MPTTTQPTNSNLNDKSIDLSNLDIVTIDSEAYLKISNSDKIPPFFMSIVSNSNHWLFISSNGGLTAGRKDPESSLFPYYTNDKITESTEITGSKSIFWISKKNVNYLWEPFSIRNEGKYNCTRNLFKSVYGNKILFEEINHDLEITFSYRWNSSQEYGFVRESFIHNNSSDTISISIVDGIQNIVPNGVGSFLQNNLSNLTDAYKRNELESRSGIGIYALSANIVDNPEPSEALKATIAWSLGIEQPIYLLSSQQLNNFRVGLPLHQENDIKGEKGAYFIHTQCSLQAGDRKEWLLVANVNQTVSTITALSKAIQTDVNQLKNKIQLSIDEGTRELIQINSAADGLHLTADKLRDVRHFANTLFNCMRGGIFDNNYQLEKMDVLNYFQRMNPAVAKKAYEVLQNFPEVFTHAQLYELAWNTNDYNLIRLSMEYLPLKFSRRHGDPSRPWNKFSINTQNEIDGSKILDYAGNWRDIFQNWEALAYSYPSFIEGMIFRFLNASTFDGYNPYRITKYGIDWETIEPDDPWSHIGYWGDHQLIYLLKFLEFSNNYWPEKLQQYVDKDAFVYANVPYKIKSYESILKNPKDTIDFDHELDSTIKKRWNTFGADSALLLNQRGEIHHVNFIEKILATILSKISNFIPEGGIWMNTQRPEWNDANNALVGNGVSVVTLCYLGRFLGFLSNFISNSKNDSVQVSAELVDFFNAISSTLETHQSLLNESISNRDRKIILDSLGTAASNYREKIYKQSFSATKISLSLNNISGFISLSQAYVNHTLKSNKRNDNLYHAYNLMSVDNENEISISYLSEMLEGQVAILSSGYLSSPEALQVLDSLRKSTLYREDQKSYILYPNKELAGFMFKNNIPASSIEQSQLLSTLIKNSNKLIIEKDVEGRYHFNGNLKNAKDLDAALQSLAKTGYTELVTTDRNLVRKIYEDVFNHKAFTGRSGTFFGYEGLGSIYWHMVSKLLLAVHECCQQAYHSNEDPTILNRLAEHYHEINEGIGVHKSPQQYGAFPTDPYSHTPLGRGAQQPGMTGQVKEDILSRFAELGVFVKEGQLCFAPYMLRKDEMLTKKQIFKYYDVHGKAIELPLDEQSLCFTYCQIPIIYKSSNENSIEVVYKNNSSSKFNSLNLNGSLSQKVFNRTGEVSQIIVHINSMILR